MVSDNIAEEKLRDMRMEKAQSLQSAFDMVLSEKEGQKVAFCPMSYRCIFSIE